MVLNKLHKMATATGHQTEVPYHTKSLKKGLEQAILKQAGLR